MNCPKTNLLDLCAAPGSKSLQASEIFKVTANELDKRRFKILKQRCEPFGIKCVQGDAFKLLEHIKPNQYQILLLDPTCSSSGTHQMDRQLASLTEASKQSEENVAELASFQKQILGKALREGIRANVKLISYSTCSVNDEENEQVVEHVLETIDGWRLIKVLDSWQERGLRHDEVVRSSVPGDGFFVAVF